MCVCVCVCVGEREKGIKMFTDRPLGRSQQSLRVHLAEFGNFVLWQKLAQVVDLNVELLDFLQHLGKKRNKKYEK